MNGVLEIYSKLKEGEPMKKGVATIRKVNVTEDEAYYSNIRYIIDDKKFMCICSGQYIILDIKGKGIMMSDTPMEKRTNKDFVKKANGRVFIAGLGIGLIIHNLKSKIQSGEVSEIVVFELEQDVIDLVAPYFQNEKIKIIKQDIFQYEPKPDDVFDTIYFDIWETISDDNLDEMLFLHKKWKGNLNKENERSFIDSWLKKYLEKERKKELNF